MAVFDPHNPVPASLERNQRNFEKLAGDINDLSAFHDTCLHGSLIPAYLDTPDGKPIFGLAYQTNPDGGEEWCVANIVKALRGGDEYRFHQTQSFNSHAGVFCDVSAIVLSELPLHKRELRWGDALMTWEREPRYLGMMRDLDHYQGVWQYRWMRMQKLREVARELGISPLPRRKHELLEAIIAKAPRERPNTWPAYNDGSRIILRADRGPAQRVVEHLKDAVMAGTLAVGSPTSNPFVRASVFLYDARDETPGLQEQRKAYHDWYRARMAEVEEPLAALREQGYWVKVSRVDEFAPGDRPRDVYYFLNWSGPRTGRGDEPRGFGWHSVEQIKAGDLIPYVPAGAGSERGVAVSA
jgi:hypothetical protein